MSSAYFEASLNMDRVCRICLTEATHLSPIFNTNQDATEFSGLPQKIQVCGAIEIHERDGLPTMICDVCIYKATVANEFRQQCQHSDAKLRMYYNKPARAVTMECYTQTEGDISVTLSKTAIDTQETYFEKGEIAPVQTGHEYVEANLSSDTYVRTESNLTTDEIDIQDEKLFVCTMSFEGPKNTTKNSSTESPATTVDHTDDNITDNISFQNKAENSEELKTYTKQENEVQSAEYLCEVIENSNLGEEKKTLHKRTSSRRVKTVQHKSYSEGEMDDDYYDQSSDSQDSKESKFKCKICSKHYTTLKGLKKHSLVHEKKYKCNICLKMFYKEENLEIHKKIHVSKPHACQLCHACFSKSQSLVRHLKSHTEKVNDMIKQINTTGESEDNKVLKKELKQEEDTDEDTGPVNETDEFENAPELYKCEVCSQYCSSLKNLKRHALVHGDKKYSCTVCKKWFFRPDTLKKHAEKHGHGLLDNLVDDNKLYDSDDDTSTNPTVSQPQHTNNDKKDDSDEDVSGEYKCQHCDKVMTTKKGLRRHVSMHKPKKAEPVACDICRKVCASQARLLLHQRTHKPKEKVPRQYLCHICSKVYPSNSSLTYHMRTHTGVKPHVCKTCNSGFTTTTSLANHIRIHTGDKPFVCHVCSAAFAVSSAFRRHLTRHTGEANYLCKTCGKAFKRLSTLKEHTYTHSGEKPYVCKTCGAAYSHSGSLFAHQKRCRAQYGEMVTDDHHHTVAHHIHVTNVQSAVRSLAVIGQMF